MSLDLKNKFIGAMIGSALGDAIGELAFRYPRQDALMHAVEQASVLRYTDDTAMAIGLAESIVERGDIDQEHIGETFRRNYLAEPWRGYAPGPPKVFDLVSRHRITYKEAAKSLFGEQGSFGNGAAMRIVPVGIFFYGRPDILEKARLSAEVTHAHPIGKDGAAVQALAIAKALELDPSEPFPLSSFIESLISAAETDEIRNKMILVKELLTKGVQPSEAAREIGRSVAIHESMPFAVYSFLRYPDSYETCLMCAVLNGGDRDTLGAMAGAISGAYLGIDAIPSAWVSKLENRPYIEQLALQLLC